MAIGTASYFSNYNTGETKNCKAIARKNMRSFSTATLHSQSSTSKSVINWVSKLMRDEMKAISTDGDKSIIQDKIEGIKHFKWSILFQELFQENGTSTKSTIYYISEYSVSYINFANLIYLTKYSQFYSLLIKI